MSQPADTDTTVDYITGKRVPLAGAEENRQAVERLLVEQKGFSAEEIIVDAPITLSIDEAHYQSVVDLVILLEGRPLMAVKCAAGSLGSREREAVSAARLLSTHIIPVAVVSDGVDAIVLDAVSGSQTGSGVDDIPNRDALLQYAAVNAPVLLDEGRRYREQLVFRSYDSMNVNRFTQVD